MPDQTPDQNPDSRPEPDVLTGRLAALAGDSAQQSRLMSAADVRRRAARRRTGHVAAVAASTAAVLAVGWSVAAPGADTADDPVQPVDSPSTTAETTSPTEPLRTTSPRTPARTNPTTMDYTPTPLQPPPAATAGPTPASGWVTTIPADVRLPFQGVKSTDSDATDWTSLRGVTGWLLTPCEATTAYPSDADRTDLRSIGYNGVEYAASEQLALYADDDGAIAAMTQLRRAVSECAAERTTDATHGSYTDSYWNYVDAADLTSAGGLQANESFVSWNWNRTYDLQGNPQYGLGGGFFVVTRVGNAVFLTVSDGETDYAEASQVQTSRRQYSPTTRGFLADLCGTFADADGC